MSYISLHLRRRTDWLCNLVSLTQLRFCWTQTQISFFHLSKLLPSSSTSPHTAAKEARTDPVPSNSNSGSGQEFYTNASRHGVGTKCLPGLLWDLETFSVHLINQESVTNIFDRLWQRDGQESPWRNISRRSFSTKRSQSYDFAFLKIHSSLGKLNRRLATSL